jgi:septum formation protein
MGRIRQKFPLILASSSKVRKKILQDLGLEFQVITPDFDEDKAKETTTYPSFSAQALYLAQQKALSISKKHKDALVIGSDQICQLQDAAILKPKNQKEAIDQLKNLNGKIHTQNNAVSIYQNSKEIFCVTQKAELKMRIMSEKEITAYVKLDKPIGCAGSYKIESFGRHLFKEIKGDIHCISGIAIQPVLDYLYQNQLIELLD